MNIIAAVDENWGIGKKNRLLVQIPIDQAFFRQETYGKVVVMGRKTLESFANKVPLQGRTNIVLSRNPDYKVRNAIVVHSIEELHARLAEYASKDIYVIGGEQIYRQLLDECDTAHITRINYRYDADAYFPNLEEAAEWRLTGASEEQTYFDLEFTFCRYERTGRP